MVNIENWIQKINVERNGNNTKLVKWLYKVQKEISSPNGKKKGRIYKRINENFSFKVNLYINNYEE